MSAANNDQDAKLLRLHAQEWVQRGFAAFPVKGRTPLVQWSSRAARNEVDAEALFTQYRQADSIGVALGTNLNGICVVVVDIDGDQGWADLEAMPGFEAMPETFVTASGSNEPGSALNRSHKHYWFIWPSNACSPPSSHSKIKINGKESCVDIKGQGGMVHVPPSMHASGRRYEIAHEAPLAFAPRWLIAWREEYLAEVERRHQEQMQTMRSAVVEHDLTTQEIENFAISYLTTRAKPAIQGENGSRAAFQAAVYLVIGLMIPIERAAQLMFDYYNPQCSPPWSSKDLQHKCASASRDSTMVPGYALEFVPREIADPLGDDYVTNMIERVKPQPGIMGMLDRNPKPKLAVLPNRKDNYDLRLALYASQRRDQMTIWREIAALGDNHELVLRWLGVQQPLLSVMGLLALGSSFINRRFHTRTKLIPSLYMIGVAASGAGKGEAKDRLTSKVKSKWGGLFMSATWPSVQAVFKTIHIENSINGHGVCFHDNEIGKILSLIFDTKTNENRRSVARLLLDCNPVTSSRVVSSAKALMAGGGEDSVIAPYVSMYGTTTPVALTGLLQSDARTDGLIARTLFFRGVDGGDLYDHSLKLDDNIVDELFDDAIDEHNRWWAACPRPGSTTEDGHQVVIYDPKDARYTPEAIVELNMSARYWHEEKTLCDEPDKASVLARAQEHVEKIALILAGIRCLQQPTVTKEDAVMAKKIAMQCIGAVAPIIDISEGAKTEFGRVRQIVLDYISEGATPKTTNEIAKKVRNVPSKARREVLASLVEEGAIQMTSVPSKRGGPPTVTYRVSSL